ncbi:hypothetical protein GOP47_0023215 [Adiantum capillus-veneris]|uniref:Uncharacterized protein n=1 Tax=Adiantum capillus-veneris TaxID=13818 RepID=A0A9D4U6Y6_ADICA|nr:hypothetical protein GOP47_0022712 [Adiantum capillus-veneris]KAI5062676.1 hypothetical protein GOP47_0023215 [Adiantum capillus-veneris]
METTSAASEIERLERKVDMSLDDIIKMQKKMQRKALLSTQKRKSTRKLKRKNTCQDSVATRPSAVQQGRIAKSRRVGREFNILAPRNTAQKAAYRNDRAKMKKRNRKRSNKNTRASGETTPNIKVLVPHDLRRRLLSGARKGGVAARLSSRSEKMESSGSQRNLQTLDSRFASLSRGRQVPTGAMRWPGRDGL